MTIAEPNFMAPLAAYERVVRKGIGGHHPPAMKSDDWLTPPDLLEAIGAPDFFDLDPCASMGQPWQTADIQFTKVDNGLTKPWHGTVWMNPPYSRENAKWFARLADHGDGIGLTFARTETEFFRRHVWERADALFFIYGRLHFHYPNGARCPNNSGGPSVLIAYGDNCATRLQEMEGEGWPGKFVRL